MKKVCIACECFAAEVRGLCHHCLHAIQHHGATVDTASIVWGGCGHNWHDVKSMYRAERKAA